MHDLILAVNLLNVAEIFYILSIVTVKISLAVFFLRLTVELWQRRVVLVALAVSCSFSVLMFFFVVFQCGVYDNSTVFLIRRFSNQCVSDKFTLGMTYTHGIITMLTDWAFLVLPFFVLKKSLMNRNEKTTVVLILMFASIGGIASIVRFKYIQGLAVPGPNAKDIGIWSCLEPGIAIVAGCVVTLRPLIRRSVFLFKNSNYSGSIFSRRRSPPIPSKIPSGVHLQPPQRHNYDPDFSPQQASVQEMDLVEEKEFAKREARLCPPVAKKRPTSGLPLHLFGSVRSSASSKRTKSTKSGTPRLSHFSNAHTIQHVPSFIGRGTIDETDQGSTKDSEPDDNKRSGRGDFGMGSNSTRLDQDIEKGERRVGPSPTLEEEENWLEEQLRQEQCSPTGNEHERRFSQRTELYSSGSSIASPRFASNSARAQSLRWQQRYESVSYNFSGVPEAPAVPSSPLFPEGHDWIQPLNLGESRPSSSVPEPESARLSIGLQMRSALSPPVTPHMPPRDTPPITPRSTPHRSQSHGRQQRPMSIMQARIENILSAPASDYEGRTSEDSIRWPSTPETALQEETLRTNQDRFSQRMSALIFPQRSRSRAALPQDNAVRFHPYSAVPEPAPTISPRRFWQQKPLPRSPPEQRMVLSKGVMVQSAPSRSVEGKEKENETDGLPLDMFSSSSSRKSSSSESST
ncbi:hypothetical protein EG328_008532 [Venturia inaequalis]|uniref:Rhodopsin domain-containing protein n=1 Tax=Venturia inaequalis TaxID=5025 RepID=A0A8H3UB54_VENIN|nr:hypothetical protein EG328_008532 [Venturia inaequalis]